MRPVACVLCGCIFEEDKRNLHEKNCLADLHECWNCHALTPEDMSYTHERDCIKIGEAIMDVVHLSALVKELTEWKDQKLEDERLEEERKENSYTRAELSAVLQDARKKERDLIEKGLKIRDQIRPERS